MYRERPNTTFNWVLVFLSNYPHIKCPKENPQFLFYSLNDCQHNYPLHLKMGVSTLGLPCSANVAERGTFTEEKRYAGKSILSLHSATDAALQMHLLRPYSAAPPPPQLRIKNVSKFAQRKKLAWYGFARENWWWELVPFFLTADFLLNCDTSANNFGDLWLSRWPVVLYWSKGNSYRLITIFHIWQENCKL